MGEITPFSEFAMLYSMRHGEFPPTYYRNRTAEFKDYVPSKEEMISFLETGKVADENPWKKITYHIPQNSQQDVFSLLHGLFEDFDYRVSPRLNSRRRLIGGRIELLGEMESGERPIIEGILDEVGKVRKVNLVRRQLAVTQRREAVTTISQQ